MISTDNALKICSLQALFMATGLMFAPKRFLDKAGILTEHYKGRKPAGPSAAEFGDCVTLVQMMGVAMLAWLLVFAPLARVGVPNSNKLVLSASVLGRIAMLAMSASTVSASGKTLPLPLMISNIAVIVVAAAGAVAGGAPKLPPRPFRLDGCAIVVAATSVHTIANVARAIVAPAEHVARAFGMATATHPDVAFAVGLLVPLRGLMVASGAVCRLAVVWGGGKQSSYHVCRGLVIYYAADLAMLLTLRARVAGFDSLAVQMQCVGIGVYIAAAHRATVLHEMKQKKYEYVSGKVR